MIDTVLAPVFGDEITAISGAQLLAVSEAFPRARRIELGPAAVVRIIALVGQPGKWAVLLGQISTLAALALDVRRRSARPCSQ